MTRLPESVRERYQVLRRVGSGAAGTVLLAHDRQLGRDVAIKILHERATSMAENTARFAREVALLVKHPHPCLVPVLDADVAADPPYLVSHWMPGGSLHQRIRRRLATPEEVARAGVRLADALAHLHDHGVLHRDVKPANILLDEQDEVYLADLGLGHSADMSHLTETGYLVGTPRYMAPELLEQGKYSPRSDLYALGVSLVEMARRPTDMPDMLSINALQELTAGIGNRPLRQVLRRALRSDPGERWPHAATMREALAALAQGDVPTDGPGAAEAAGPGSEEATATQALVAPPGSKSPPPERGATGPHSRARIATRARRGGVAAGVLVTALAAGLWLTQAPPPPTPPPPATPPRDAVGDGVPRAALDRLLEGHRYPDGSVRPALHGGDYVRHEAQVVEDMLDPRFSIRWRRLLDGLDTWALDVGFEDPDRAALDAAVRPLLDEVHHLACDQMIARLYLFRVSTPLVHGVSRPPEGAAAAPEREHLASLQARVEEVRNLVRDALRENALLRAPPGTWSEVLRLRLQGLVADEHLHEGVDRALQLATQTADPVSRAHVLAAGLTCMPTTLHDATLPCEGVIAVYQEALAFATSPPEGLPTHLRLELACDLVLQWFANGSKCLPKPSREATLLQVLALTTELMPADPSLPLQVLTFAAHQLTTTRLVGRGVSAEVEAQMLHALDRARAEVGR